MLIVLSNKDGDSNGDQGLMVIGNGHQILPRPVKIRPKRLARKFARIPQNCGSGAAGLVLGIGLDHRFRCTLHKYLASQIEHKYQPCSGNHYTDAIF